MSSSDHPPARPAADEAEKALRQSEERFRALVNSSLDGILAYDKDIRYTLWNPAMERISGVKAEALLGKSPFEVFPFLDEVGEGDSFRNAVAGRATLRSEMQFTVPETGRQGWFESSHFPLFDAEGNVIGGTGIIRDITQRKRMEQEAEVARTRLLEHQQKAKETAEAELEKARDRLVRQTRLATIGQVAASIAHELRNPLSGIRNAAFLLKRSLPPESASWRKYLEMIDQEIAVADQIITGLLAMSRGRMPTNKPVALETIVSKARRRLDAPQTIQWQEVYQPAPFVIQADPDLLEHVLTNLFTNSIQAFSSAETSFSAEIRDRQGRITVEASRSEEHDQILVADDGPGIPAKDRERIFEPLFTTKSRGTGLGLTICRQIIARHGGTIEAVDPDRGAAFRIRLPRKKRISTLGNVE